MNGGVTEKVRKFQDLEAEMNSSFRMKCVFINDNEMRDVEERDISEVCEALGILQLHM